MKHLTPFCSPKMGSIKHIHFVGIGGVGMCGIAEVLHNEGYVVSGSDLTAGKTTQRLIDLGMQVFIGHEAKHMQNADVVVKSTSIADDNPEVVAARAQLIPVIPRAVMLAELMRFRHGIAVAGTHGKTTTTSLVSSLLAEAGLDPSYVIGGKLNHTGSHAQLGHSPYFVAEADESDASFLFLKPMMAIVTNIDADHMSTYGNDFKTLKQAFIKFLHQLPFYGRAVVCVDDPEVRSILPKIERPTRTYGFAQDAHYRATDWVQHNLVSHFTVHRPAPHAPLHIQFSWPGRHNILNALAAIAIATELGLDASAICQGLATFEGVARRFQILGTQQFSQGQAYIIDDYGHHPNEIAATLDTCRRVWPNQRLIHVFQPHRYSRTEELFSQFVEVLSQADELLLLDIYAAGEAPIPGISSTALLEQIKLRHPHAQLVTPQTLPAALDQLILPGICSVLMQGAGSISQLAHTLLSATETVVS